MPTDNTNNTVETPVEKECETCDSCGCKDETVSYVNDVRERLCLSCADELSQCDSCNRMTYDLEDTHLGSLCEDCFAETVVCNECSERQWSDTMYWDNDSDLWLCRYCYQDSGRHVSYRNINFNTAKEIYDRSRERGEIIKSPRKFGVEFEIVPNKEVSRKDSDGKFDYTPDFSCWGVQDDGSLNDGGVEVVTPPMRLKKGEEALRTFSKNAKSSGWTVDNSCGTHVHLDAPEFKSNTKLLRRLVLSYILLDKAIISMLPKRRRSNSYCSPLDRRNAVLGKAHQINNVGYTLGSFFEANTISKIKNLIYKTKTDTELQAEMEQHYSDCRYYGINFHSLWNRNYNTVEIRYHQGTIDADELLPWIAFHQHILDNARKMDDSKALLLRGIKNPVDRLVSYALYTKMDKRILDAMIKRINKYKKNQLCVE